MVTLFADDTFLKMESTSNSELKKKTNQELRNVSDWLIANNLTLINIGKCKYMIIGNQKNISSAEFSVTLNETKLERCADYKYLGVMIDNKLSWKAHVQYISQKNSKTCGALAKLQHCLDASTLKSVYYALVFSHTNYCNLIWGDAEETVMKPL